MRCATWSFVGFFVAALFTATSEVPSQGRTRTAKPVLHGRHWVAITGKPLAATAGARIFQQGGNAVDAACAMLGATCTMWDTLSWGGETQVLIYDPHQKKVIGINGLGAAPTGATAKFYKDKGFKYPPGNGPLSAVTPGTPGALMVMLAEWGSLSLGQVLAPSIEMADGYPIEASAARGMNRSKERIADWPYTRAVYLPHAGEEREGPRAGEIFRQHDLRDTLIKLVDGERKALAAGKDRKQAIYAAYDRFHRGDIAEELVRGIQEQGGLLTMADLDKWQVHIEEPVKTTYRGIEVYKLTHWVQGPVLLQALNMLEQLDLKAMGLNSTKYIHTLYQVMNCVYADRDFYYGDPYYPPEEPIRGLLSKEYAKARLQGIDWDKNDPRVGPGDPYPFQGGENPFAQYLAKWRSRDDEPKKQSQQDDRLWEQEFHAGTTSVQAADKEGWIVSMTPSGGWIPAVIAGRTGIGLSQRAQSFVLDPSENPYNVIEPGKRPRATLTPSLALKDGKPWLSFSLQGGDAQDQNLLQLFLNMVEFGMNVQQACEGPNINSGQMHSSFGAHTYSPGRLTLHESVPDEVVAELEKMGYQVRKRRSTSGPLNAIWFDWANGTMWGGSSNNGEDYGIAW